MINKTLKEINHNRKELKTKGSFKQLINFDKNEFSTNTKILKLTYKRPNRFRDLLRNNHHFEK